MFNGGVHKQHCWRWNWAPGTIRFYAYLSTLPCFLSCSLFQMVGLQSNCQFMYGFSWWGWLRQRRKNLQCAQSSRALKKFYSSLSSTWQQQNLQKTNTMGQEWWGSCLTKITRFQHWKILNHHSLSPLCIGLLQNDHHDHWSGERRLSGRISSRRRSF